LTESLLKYTLNTEGEIVPGKFRNQEPFKAGFGSILNPGMGFESFFGGQVRKPKFFLPTTRIPDNFFEDGIYPRLRITWLGHSSLIIEIAGTIILTDPIFSRCIAPPMAFGPRRFKMEFPLDPSTLPCIDGIIISHNHFDHMDYPTIQSLKGKTRRFYVPLGLGLLLEKWGVHRDKIMELDWWGAWQVNDTLKITATPAFHFSGRGVLDRNASLWASWVIRGKRHNLFFSGDSGYFAGFREIGEKQGPFDVTMLDTAQYGKYWKQVHMFPEQAVRAHQDLRGDMLLPVHWGAFSICFHDWQEPAERILQAAGKENITVALPKIGQSFIYDADIPQESWWPPIRTKTSKFRKDSGFYRK
jgi:L-ascorbate metabolism protein UlaG (beta-lactamase superfamily)